MGCDAEAFTGALSGFLGPVPSGGHPALGPAAGQTGGLPGGQQPWKAR